MKILIKILISLTLVTLCQGCAVLYSNRIEKQKSNVRLSAWTVVISKHSYDIEPLEKPILDYGSLVHPQAVLTLNSTALYKPFKKYKCLGGCWNLQNSNQNVIKDCQVRDFSRVFSIRGNPDESSNGNNSFAVIILKSPFDLSTRISLIKVASKAINYSNCYFYGVTALSILDQNNRPEENAALIAPYRAELVNDSARIFKYDGVNYTHIIEDTYLNVKSSEVIFTLNYRGNPVVCQKNDTNHYEQIGFFNIYADFKKPFEQQRWELFTSTTYAYEKIYELLNKYFESTV